MTGLKRNFKVLIYVVKKFVSCFVVASTNASHNVGHFFLRQTKFESFDDEVIILSLFCFCYFSPLTFGCDVLPFINCYKKTMEIHLKILKENDHI